MSGAARYNDLMGILSRDDRVLCIIRPDPDSMAGALALRCLLARRAACVEIAYDEAIHRLENRAMVRLLKIPIRHVREISFREFNRLAVVDSQPAHLPEYSRLRFDIVIDHHPVVEGQDYAFADIRPELGATSTIMEEYLRAAKARIGTRLATALCYGIKSDTDNFQRDVSRADAEAFSRLFPRADFKLLELIEQVEVPLRELHYFRDALDRIRVRRRAAVIHIGEVGTPDIAVIIADFLLRVSGIEFVAISCMMPEKLVVIMRSRNPQKKAGEIAARAFGDMGSAGGHDSSARAEIPRAALEKGLLSGDAGLIEDFIRSAIRAKGRGPAGKGKPKKV